MACVLACALTAAAAPAGAVRSEEVTLRNGKVTLAGTLILPERAGPHPAVVFLHGSGPVTREGAAPYAERFAAIGLADGYHETMLAWLVENVVRATPSG